MSELFELIIPPGLYIVHILHKDGFEGELPACDLTKAREEARRSANQYNVETEIEGIGPERGFKEVVKPECDSSSIPSSSPTPGEPPSNSRSTTS